MNSINNVMKLSNYIKVYLFEEKPGHLLLYSTKRASMTLLKEGTYKSLLNGTLSSENQEVLEKLGMVVPDRELEKQEVMGFIDEINEKNKTLNISVIINLDCNFDCIYCYEGGQKGKRYMDNETADLLVDFIKNKLTPGIKSVNLDFYGGEPLLSAERIKSISASVKSFAESRGAKFTFTLVTNASLFKRRIAEELVDLGLTGIKTTLDGPPETHNACRPFKSGAPSFGSIIKNLKETNDLVKIAIGGNYKKDNYKKFPLLIDYLEKEGLTPDRIYELKFDPAMNSPKEGAAPADFTDGLMSINEPWVIESGAMLREEVLKRGYGTPKITPSPCQVELENACVVNFDGGIYKCPAWIGKKEFEIGNLRNGVADYSQSHKLGIWKNEECEACEYLPLCFGGCRYMSYVRDGNIDKVDCKKPYLDATLEKMIKQDIEYRALNKKQ